MLRSTAHALLEDQLTANRIELFMITISNCKEHTGSYAFPHGMIWKFKWHVEDFFETAEDDDAKNRLIMIKILASLPNDLRLDTPFALHMCSSLENVDFLAFSLLDNTAGSR